MTAQETLKNKTKKSFKGIVALNFLMDQCATKDIVIGGSFDLRKEKKKYMGKIHVNAFKNKSLKGKGLVSDRV